MKVFQVLLFLNILFESFCLELSAQVIGGKIIQISDGEAVPFTTIAIEGTTLGMVTDYDGNFVFEIPSEHRKNNLVVSCVGFKERKIKLSSILGKLDNVIKLESTSVEIDEVLVEEKSLLPYTILKKASDAVASNYLTNPFNYEVHYKNIQKLNSGQKLERESIVLFYDKKGYNRSNSFKTFKELNYKFQQTKRNFEVSDLSLGNTDLDDIIEMDIARNQNNILDKRRVYDFDVIIKDKVVHKGDSAWVLIYKCNKPGLLRTGDYYASSYSGEIIVSMSNYVVLYNRTDVKSNSNSSVTRNLFVNKEGLTSYVTNMTYTFETTYKTLNNFSVLDQIFYKVDYLYNSDDKNQVMNSESLFKVLKVILKNPVIIERREYFENLTYDSQFWANFNQ